MFVRFRPARLSDLPICRDSVRDRYAYTDAEAEELEALWRELIVSGAANAAVMENVSAPPDRNFLWYCIAAFPTNGFTRELAACPVPHVAKSVLNRLRSASSPAPLLTADQIRGANSTEGLNYLVLNSGGPSYMMVPDVWREVANRLVDFCVYHAQGYRIRELMIESYDTGQAAWFSQFGMTVRNAYPSFVASKAKNRPGPSAPPALYGCSFEEAIARQGSVISCMMMYREPVIYFSVPEQHLLLHALSGDTDDELASLLECSQPTVRKRWLAIYEKIGEHPRTHDVLPAFLGTKGPIRGQRTAEQAFKRGTEKKRILLQYLRQHMEELRPAREPVGPWW